MRSLVTRISDDVLKPKDFLCQLSNFSYALYHNLTFHLLNEFLLLFDC